MCHPDIQLHMTNIMKLKCIIYMELSIQCMR